MAWPLAAAAAAGALNWWGQNRANRQNREFAASEALKNRQFQERMSSTAWQRGMADMRAAGINPMLAVDKGGASTPGGAMGSANMLNELGGAASSAAQVAMIKQNLENAKAQGDLLDQQWSESRAREDNLDAQTGKTQTETRHLAINTPYLRKLAENLENFESGFVGENYRHVQPLLDLLNPILTGVMGVGIGRNMMGGGANRLNLPPGTYYGPKGKPSKPTGKQYWSMSR